MRIRAKHTIATVSVVLLAGLTGCRGPGTRHVVKKRVFAPWHAVETARIEASDSSSPDQFGYAVAVHGNVALIGAHYDDEHGNKAGAAYVLRQDGQRWVEESKLTAGRAGEGDQFGTAVAVGETWAAVGAPFSERGCVYVYHLEGGSWREVDRLEPFDHPRRRNSFGWAVAMHGRMMLIGASGDDDGGHSSGAVYAYHLEGAQWVSDGKLTASDGNMGQQFGFSVALDGDTGVVGGWCDQEKGNESGSAYVFRYHGHRWHEEAKLTAPDAAPLDHFGQSVAISGDVIAIGAPRHDARGSDSGAVYVFRCRDRRWALEDKLTALDATKLDWFGQAVAVRSRTIVVGTPMGGSAAVPVSGAAYLFRHDGGRWPQQGKLTASDAAFRDAFGSAVTLGDGLVLVGAPWRDTHGAKSAGSVYGFSSPQGPDALTRRDEKRGP